jgi:hypothetical protein
MAEDIDERVARLAARVVVAETIMATCVGFVLRSVPVALRDEILTELRNSIKVEPGGFPDPDNAQRAVLRAEHDAHHLIDQIERLARS